MPAPIFTPDAPPVSTESEVEYRNFLAELGITDGTAPSPAKVFGVVQKLQSSPNNPMRVDLLKAAHDKYPDRLDVALHLLDALKAQAHLEAYVAAAKLCALVSLGNEAECLAMGQILTDHQDHDAASAFLSRAVSIHTKAVALWHNLGVSLTYGRRLPEALQAFRRAIELRPYSDISLTMAGSVLRELGRLGESIEFHGAAIRINPKSSLALYNLGNALQEQDQLDAAVNSYSQALVIQPEWPELLNNLCTALFKLARFQHLLPLLLKLAKLRGNPPEDLSRISVTLRELNRPADALEIADILVQQFPDNSSYRLLRGGCLTPMGRSREAAEEYARIIENNPGDLRAHNALVYVANYLPHKDPAELFAFYRKYADLVESSCAANRYLPRPHAPFPRKLRIGYVSGDFCQHPVGTFIKPVLAHHDRSAFEVFCYYNHTRKDQVTLALKQQPVHWRDIPSLTDKNFCELAREDQIDILVDLSGHTSRNRLAAFALKPVPIQVTMIGCMQTTGLKAMDYRITDAILDPPGTSEHLHSEKLVRMDTGPLCFEPHPNAPETSPLPSRDRGIFTFGSFNNLAKATPEVLDVWSKVLLSVPASEMQVTADSPDIFLQDMESRGVPRSRFRVLPRLTEPQYLAAHADVDLILDTFPYCGLTVSMNALWMGVPMINLIGNTSASRAGASVLQKLGLDNFITQSPKEYIRTAVQFAENPESLVEIRATLRARMRLHWADATKHTLELETQFRNMWQAYSGAMPLAPRPLERQTEPHSTSVSESPKEPRADTPPLSCDKDDASWLHEEITTVINLTDPSGTLSKIHERLKATNDAREIIAGEEHASSADRADWKRRVLCTELYAAIDAKEDAQKCLEQIQDCPEASGDWAWMARSLLRANFEKEAENAFRKACSFEDVTPDVTLSLACILSRKGGAEEAEHLCRVTIGKSPSMWQAYLNLGNLLYQRGNFAEALAISEPAARLSSDPTLLLNLAAYQQKTGDFEKSLVSLEKALEKDPSSASGYLNLGNSLMCLGMPLEAIAAYKKARNLDPKQSSYFSNYLHCQNYLPHSIPEDVFQLHREFSETFETPLLPHKPHLNSRDSRRKIRIAYVSPDFRTHSVSYFIEPLLRHHDRSQFEVVGVLSHTWKDDKTHTLKERCDEWIDAGNLDDVGLAQKLRDECIDIAVDLVCHSQGSRVLMFARKPAPVQLTMIGMQQTTGLQSIDYRVTDAVMDPPGMTERFHSEKLMRLPSAMCLQPPETSLPINPLPALEKGVVTFGSFNNFAKANLEVLRTWAEVLRRVPDSRLIVVAPKGTMLEATMAAEGIAPERIIISDRKSESEYLRMHHEVDMLLDCFPFAGLTVTALAAWMGVPTITIAGHNSSARGGASIMHSLDLDSFVASDPADFVNKAVALSANLPMLAAVRASMRERMAVQYTNGEAYTRAFEAELRKAWQQWCDGQVSA